MTPRFILITTAAILLAGCDHRSAEVNAANAANAVNAAEIAQQRQAEQAANDRVRQLEERLNAADQLKASEREAELARVKEELAQVKRDKDLAAERIRDLQSEADKQAPPPIAEAPSRNSVERRPEAIRADLERVVEEDYEDENVPESDPVYVGRVVPQTQRVTTVESFYEPLDRYGDWIETDDYGYVFRPEVSRRRDWRPYTDGRWAHSGHGWTWESNEDFGWATYHYGRWTRVESAGWVWVPGREWGPGWVSWRRGKDECGWAPLPPESRGRHSFTATVDRDYDIGPSAYVFIALSNFGARSYAPVIERPERNVAIINQTVNVTNITYNNTTNNTVVYNGGPNYDVIRARSKQPVENVRVNFAPQAPAGDRGKIVNLRQGNNFQIAAPPAAVAANTAPPRVKERLGKAKEDKGWAGVDAVQARKVKQEIAATSTDRPRRPRPPGGVVNPAAAKPATLPVIAPPTLPARPERPAIVAPDGGKPPVDPAKPPQVMPRPERPSRPAVVEKPRPLDPDAARPKPAVEVPPKGNQPDEPKKPADTEPPKMREPEPARPKPVQEIPPNADKPDESKKPGENQPPKVREPESSKPVVSPKPGEPEPRKKPAENRILRLGDEERQRPGTPSPNPNGGLSERAKRAGENEPRRFNPNAPETRPPSPDDAPKRRPATPTPVVRERQRPVAPPDAPARVKPQTEAPARVRGINPERPVSQPPQPKVERRPVAPPPERAAQVSRPVEQPVRRVVQSQRPPQEMRAPKPRVNRPAPQPAVERAPERMQRPPAPVVQRPPHAVPQLTPQQRAAEEAEKRKKKKDGG